MYKVELKYIVEEPSFEERTPFQLKGSDAALWRKSGQVKVEKEPEKP